jgi:hypothetical protein
MKYNKYTNVVGLHIMELNRSVNDMISKGCKPIGGLVIHHIGDTMYYIQTMVVEDETNAILGYYIDSENQ